VPRPARLLTHVVGGVGVEIEGGFALAPEYERLIARCEGPAEIVVRLDAIAGSDPFRPTGAAAVEVDSWAAFVDEATLRLCVKPAGRAPTEAMRIELPRNGLEGRYLHDDNLPYLIQYPIDQLLIIHALGVAGGLLAHGAAICGRDGALLVAGPSGAGKTTMSRATAALGARVLSDERTIVRPRAGGGWLLGGTPWPGEGGFAENRSVPLRGLILLEQAERDELVPLSPARALALLYRCHFPPLWDPVAAERTLGHLENLVRDVPAFLFRNRKGPDAAQRLLDRVGGAA
jgi:hypothetical protein